jgi:hypothetical protein
MCSSPAATGITLSKETTEISTTRIGEIPEIVTSDLAYHSTRENSKSNNTLQLTHQFMVLQVEWEANLVLEKLSGVKRRRKVLHQVSKL